VLKTLPSGEAHRGAFFVATDGVPPLMALPVAEDVVFFNVIYPQILPQFLDDTLAAFQRAGELLTEAGGKRYVADWLGEMGDADWRGHFGTGYGRWVEAKETFDRHGTFLAASPVSGEEGSRQDRQGRSPAAAPSCAPARGRRERSRRW